MLEATICNISLSKKNWSFHPNFLGSQKIQQKKSLQKNLTKNLDLSNLSTNLSGLSGHLTLHFFCIDDLFGHCDGPSDLMSRRWLLGQLEVKRLPRQVLREVQVMVAKNRKAKPSRYYIYTIPGNKKTLVYIYICKTLPSLSFASCNLTKYRDMSPPSIRSSTWIEKLPLKRRGQSQVILKDRMHIQGGRALGPNF